MEIFIYWKTNILYKISYRDFSLTLQCLIEIFLNIGSHINIFYQTKEIIPLKFFEIFSAEMFAI